MLIVVRDASKTHLLKREFNKSFVIKDLGTENQILGIKISRDKQNRGFSYHKKRF